ncbi:class I SAM-dependent methyltransferase [Streptomyces sp. NBC_01390]|uniref:class I SAM-dependent methyltransferase n=1 Tax=Streptomyces sp. NBC_01390 TaxID=2903850 RepID=UPI0038631273
MPVPHDIAAETELWDAYAESAFKDDAEPSFCWTQYAGHGPGPELLGSPKSVLEIGCGTGRALAHLAQQGVKATGVDLSPRMEALAGWRSGAGGRGGRVGARERRRHRAVGQGRLPLRARQVCEAMDVAVAPNNINSVRLKLKRPVQVLAETEQGLFTLPRP